MEPEARPLRVLFLITDLGKGGAERFLIDLCAVLSRRADVDVVIGSLFDRDLYYPLTAALRIEQLHFETFSLRGPNGCPAYLDLLQRFRPDVVHTHRFLAEFLSSYYVFPDIAYVCHGHDNMVQLARPSWRALSDRDSLMNIVERWHLIHRKYKKVPTAFLANSRHTYDYYRRVLPGYMKDDVQLIPAGFNFERFFHRDRRPPRENQRLRLLNVGSFQAKKNQILLVGIARELCHRGVDFELNLLGDGPERKTVAAAVAANDLTDRVIFHGNVQEVEAWMRASDIYLHTATYEPFGLVFLEAMAAGLPCVALDGMGNRDIIQDGHNGFLLKQQDASTFADRIVDLSRDPELYRQMSVQAQAFAKPYDIAGVSDHLVRFYRDRSRHADRSIQPTTGSSSSSI